MLNKFSIYRYNPEKDTKPYMQDYELAIEEGKDLMVLRCAHDN